MAASSPNPAAGPPRVARRLVRTIVPESERRAVEGELAEGFAERRRRRGRRAARRWYRRQVWGFVWRALVVRRLSEPVTKEGTMGWVQDLASDVRLALRGCAKRPGFTAVVASTLALGIGANAAIFTLVHAHFFEPLPYDRPERIVHVWETGRDTRDITTVAPGNYWTWREQTESFADVAAFNVDFATLSGDDVAERVTASRVVPHFFDVLGVAPRLGSGFGSRAGAVVDGDQVILSHALWSRRFGADPGLLGSDIRIDGRPHRVVGVMPADFRQPEQALSWQAPELWRPLSLEGQRENHGSRYLRAIARLDEGVSVEQARAEMDAVARRMAEAFPEANGGRSILVLTLDEHLLADVRPTLMMLMIAGVAVLLIVCANVANLTLARGEERKGEFALRAALGSGRMRLVRLIAAEGVVHAALGASVGTIAVLAGGDVLRALQARFFTNLVDVSLDFRVVAATAGMALIAGVLFGLPLARSASRIGLRGALVSGSARGGGSATPSTRNALVVAQVGLATMLLVVAGLLTRSFDALVSVPPGFEADNVVTFDAMPPPTDYPDPDDVIAYHRRLLDQLDAMPGVAAVAASSDLMFTTENRFTTFVIEGREVDPTRPLRSEYHVVTPEYFGLLGIPLLAGELPEPWVEGDEMPIVVSEHIAELHWPEGDALGAALVLDWATPRAMRIVAIVGDVLDDGYDAEPESVFYVPFSQLPVRAMSYVVRASGEAGLLFAPIRETVAGIDPDVPTADLRLLEGMMSESVARPRAASLIGGVFALIALLVAAVGIYGVLSYAVELRTREIGIRSALGAPGSRLLTMVLGHSMRLVVVGLGLGVVGALLAGRALSGLLFGVRSWDVPSLIGATFVLGSAALVAAWIPARRAVGIDPREALRQ